MNNFNFFGVFYDTFGDESLLCLKVFPLQLLFHFNSNNIRLHIMILFFEVSFSINYTLNKW